MQRQINKFLIFKPKKKQRKEKKNQKISPPFFFPQEKGTETRLVLDARYKSLVYKPTKSEPQTGCNSSS